MFIIVAHTPMASLLLLDPNCKAQPSHIPKLPRKICKQSNLDHFNEMFKVQWVAHAILRYDFQRVTVGR